MAFNFPNPFQRGQQQSGNAPPVNPNLGPKVGDAPNPNSSTLNDANANTNQHQQSQATTAVNDNKSAAAAPMDAYKGLWDTDTTNKGDKPSGYLPEITAEQLSKTLSNSNFLSSVSPEVLAKAAGGDSAAFADVINQGLRTVMTQSVLASRGLAETAVKNYSGKLQTDLPTMVRSSNVADKLQSNPIFNNPAIAPVIDGVRAQFESKYPQASAEEISNHVNTYMNGFVQLIRGDSADGKGGDAAGNKNQEVNWFELAGLTGQQ